MLKGKEFGKAIDKAIQLMLESGRAKSKAEIARHFDMKPPSLADWVGKGSVAKDKLPELYRYFSPVADCYHWGLTPAEWPAGLSMTSNSHDATRLAADAPPTPTYEAKFQFIKRSTETDSPPKTQRQIDERRVAEIVAMLDDTGLGMLLQSAESILETRNTNRLKNAV